MSEKEEKFKEATERVKELIQNSPPPPSPPPSQDTGKPENERGHTNFTVPQKENER